MRAFLCVLMVLMVTGDDEVPVHGFIGESVLLPCTCSDRNWDKDFRWQKEGIRKSPEPVFIHNRTTSSFQGIYKDRGTTFLSANGNNCSVLLTKITVEDKGEYRCCFYVEQKYTRFFVRLNVSASYTVRHHPPVNLMSGVKVYQCDVEGRYEQAKIQWKFGGQYLSNSSVTNISTSSTRDESTAVYRFNSKLMTKLHLTPTPECEVKVENISVSSTAMTVLAAPPPPSPDPDYYRMACKIIPFVLVLGFSMFLCKHRQVSQRITQV